MKVPRVVRLLTLVVPLVVLGMVLTSVSCFAATYYVSSSTGDDSYPGTQAQPWKTLWKASQITYQAGDQILLMRGDTWSDEAHPDKCELVLSGNADIRTEDWITVGAYGGNPRTDPRPHITHPSKDSTAGLLDWSSVVTWAQEHPGTGFDQYLDRTYIRIAIRIDGYGWKIEGIEISNAEMGISNHLLAGADGYWFEDIYMHDMKGLAWPKHPNYPNEIFGCSPYIFAAITMGWRNSNVTIRDVSVINNFDPLFLGGDGIYGTFNNSLIENVFLDKIYGGGMPGAVGADLTIRNITLLHGEYGEDEYGVLKGAWYGPDAICPSFTTNFVVDRSEIAFVEIGYAGADESGFCCNAGNVNLSFQNNFIHDCALEAMTFNIDYPKSLGTEITNNVTYNNGKTTYHAGYYPAEFAGDCLAHPPEYYTGEGDITFTDNRVYKRVGQALHLYPSDPPTYYNDYTYYEANAPYYWTGRNNQVFTAYDNYVPPPPATSKTNIALLSYPGFAIAVSSNSADAWKLVDGDFTTDWSPDPSDTIPWIGLGWNSTEQIDEVRLFDRRDLYNCTRAGILDFSDGTWVNVTGGIMDNGAMRQVLLDAAKNVTWMNFAPNMDRKEGTPGISEIQVYLGSGPTAPPTPPSGDGFCDFDTPTAPDALIGYYDSINWSEADWATVTGGYDGTRSACLNFQPILWPGPPSYYYPLQYAPRTFTLPPGKKLKSIRVKAPSNSVVCINQNGGGTIAVTDSRGKWKQYSPNWTTSTTDIVNVTICTQSVARDKYGVADVFFDDITYGD